MSHQKTQKLQTIDPSEKEARSLLLKKRASLEGEQVYLEALQDRELWNAYSETVQDQCIAVVERNLARAFERTETKVYECGGISHRIATFRQVKSGALLNLIPGGSYQMGSDEDEDEQPIHTVTIAPMLIGKYAVSQSVWDKIGGEDQRNWKGPELPIEGVSWKDVNAWLEKSGDGLRLPSESEWEYACRAGSTTAFCFGKTVTPEQVNYDGRYPHGESSKGLNRNKTLEVGSMDANAFGLHEVHGNVWEWCQDAYISHYNDGPNTREPRELEGLARRLVRGGSYSNDAWSCRSALRCSYTPTLRGSTFGLRVARSLD